MIRGALILSIGLSGAAGAARAQSIVGGPVTTQVTATPGQRVTIPIAVNMVGAPGIALGSYGARFSWNPGLLRLVSTTPGTFAAPVVNADSAAQGVIRFAAATSMGATGVPVLANVTLEVIATSDADTFRIAFPEMDAATTFQDLLPFLTVTTGSFCAGAIFGDLNGDGVIQALDAQIALMHAVGMAVADTGAGDVDADGAVGTRDALVILSHVVGLDVSAFRVNTFVSGVCSTGEPTELLVVPASVTLAQGDTFRVSAQSRDSAGNLVSATDLAWASSNPAVAAVDSNGTVRALANGSATITASVSPALSGVGAVTVGVRRRWRVDPANAHGPLAEIGSDAYPFSTIAAAVERAAPGDTVSLALGRYAEPLVAGAGLVFEGDSSALGMPLVSTPNRPAGQLDGPGVYVVRRLRVAESQEGIAVRGDTVRVESVSFEAVRGAALKVTGADRVTIRGVTAAGVGLVGIGVDSARVVQLASVRVTGVEPSADGAADAVGVFVRADSVFLDTLTVTGVAGAGVRTRRAERVRARRVRIEYAAIGLTADSSGTVEMLDSSVVRFIDTGGGLVADFDTLRVTGATLEDIQGPAVQQGFAWFGFHTLALAGTRIARAGAGLSAIYVGDSALITDVDVTAVAGHGVDVAALTMDVTDLAVTGAGGRGLFVRNNGRLTVDASALTDLGDWGIATSAASGRALITGTRIGDARGGGILSDHDTLELVGDTIHDIGGYGVYVSPARWLHIRDALVRRTEYQNVYASSLDRADIARSRFDSAGTLSTYAGLEFYFVDTVRVDSTSVIGSSGAGIAAYYALRAHFRRDTLEGNYRYGSAEGGVSFSAGALTIYYVDSAWARGNVIRRTGASGLYVQTSSVHQFARVDSNTVRGPWTGLYANGWDSTLSRIELEGNTFNGRMDGNESYQVYVANMGRILVRGNTFDSVSGNGVYTSYADSAWIEGNSITHQRDDGSASVGFAASRVGTARFDQNGVTCTGASNTDGIFTSRTTATVSANTIAGCVRGIRLHNDVAAIDTVSAAGNVVQGGGIAVAGIAVLGSLHATLADNRIADGVFSEGGIGITGSRFVHVPTVSVTGDSVAGGAGRGIWLRWVDTATVTGAVVTNVGSLYADTTSEAGIWLQNTFGPVTVSGSTAAGGGDAGILLTDTTRNVTLNGNLIVDNGGSGLVLRSRRNSGLAAPDTVRGTLNGIRRNAPFGVWVAEVNALLPANDVQANSFGAYNDDADTVDMRDSWWDDVLGPACVSLCDPSSTGDSIGGFALGAGFVTSPFATSPVTGAPAGTPPPSGVRAVSRPMLRLRTIPAFVAPAPPLRAPPPSPPPRPRPEGGTP